MPNASSACACARRRALLAGLGLANDKIALSARRLERAQAALDAGARALAQNARARSARRRLRQLRPCRLAGRAGGAAPASAGASRRVLWRTDPSPCAWPNSRRLPTGWRIPASKAPPWPAPSVCAHGADVRVLREPGRTALPTLALQAGTSAVWDGRFRVRAAIEAGADVDVRALGAPAFAELRQQLDMPRGSTGPSRRDAARLLARRRVNRRADAGGAAAAYPPLGGWRSGSIRPNSSARS